MFLITWCLVVQIIHITGDWERRTKKPADLLVSPRTVRSIDAAVGKTYRSIHQYSCIAFQH